MMLLILLLLLLKFSIKKVTLPLLIQESSVNHNIFTAFSSYHVSTFGNMENIVVNDYEIKIVKQDRIIAIHCLAECNVIWKVNKNYFFQNLCLNTCRDIFCFVFCNFKNGFNTLKTFCYAYFIQSHIENKKL